MRILIIQAGGTIDKDYPRAAGGYAFEISEPAAKRILERVGPALDYEVRSILRKDSLDMTAEDRDELYLACEQSGIDRIVMTHGTDTMVETARRLSAIQDKTIVITGSMRPERFSDSDAPFNLGLAVGAVQVLRPGIYVAMHGRVYDWDRVQRDPTGRFVEGQLEQRL